MISLKAFKENAAKYLHRIMIEVQPQDVVEICERAIAAEELAEARLLLLHRATHDLSNADTEIRELKTQLAQIKNTESVRLSAEKPVGYLVRGTFFYSKDQAQNSCDYITENFENCIVEPVYLSAGQPKLTVWYGPMPESNGKTNWTALLHRADSKGFDMHTDGITISRSEYPERVLYEADYVRWLIGELPTKPDILAYDADKHSGYVKPTQLESVIKDTTEHGMGFAITGTDGIQHVKQEDVLAKPFAEIDYWQGNKLYCTMLEHAENLDIGDKLYLQPPDNLQRITEQDAREIALAFVKVRNKYTSAQSSDLFSGWINTGEGSTLLAKLNEHREPNLETHNLNHLELIKAKQHSFMNCALCSHSVNVAVLVRSTNCSVHICESCAQAVNSEFK